MKTCTKCRETKPATTDFFNKLPSGNYRGACKKCMAKNTKKHYDKNPQAVMDRVSQYKDIKENVGGHTSDMDKVRIRLEQKDKCFYCSVDLNNQGELDHKTPVSRGGDNWPTNMVLSCRTCNRDKHSKTVKEFREWRRNRGESTSF